MTKPSNDPQRPPTGPGSGSGPKPPVIFVQPEIIAALNRIATAFEQTATALADRAADAVAAPDVADGVPRTWAQMAAVERGAAAAAGVCRAEVYRLGDPVPYLCNRLPGHPAAEHDPGHVAKVARKVLACSTCTGDTRTTTDMVCQTCGTDYAKGV